MARLYRDYPEAIACMTKSQGAAASAPQSCDAAMRTRRTCRTRRRSKLGVGQSRQDHATATALGCQAIPPSISKQAAVHRGARPCSLLPDGELIVRDDQSNASSIKSLSRPSLWQSNTRLASFCAARLEATYFSGASSRLSGLAADQSQRLRK